MFLQKPLLKEVLITGVLISLLHYAALTFHLYWTTMWFDVVMHFLGGFFIGLLALFTFYISEWVEFPRDHAASILAMTLGSVLLVGLGWELWEVFVGFTDALEDQVDTYVDLVMDTLGGIAAYLYGKRFVCLTQN